MKGEERRNKELIKIKEIMMMPDAIPILYDSQKAQTEMEIV